MALNPLGAGILSPFAGMLIDRIGRRSTMLISNLILFIACGLVMFLLYFIVFGTKCFYYANRKISYRIYYCIVFMLDSFIQYFYLVIIVREISPVTLAGRFSTFYIVFYRVGYLGNFNEATINIEF